MSRNFMDWGARARRSCRRALCMMGMLGAAGAGGCVQFGALWANMTGGDVVEPEFTLSKGPLLILVDDRESLVTEPKALRQLHKQIADEFLEMNVNKAVVPFEEWQRLSQTDKAYERLSIREIGEKLGAEQVLYMRVERFTLHSEPGAPVFQGEFIVRLKVLSTERKREVLLWPRESAGRRVVATTPAVSSEGDKSSSDVAGELGEKLGHVVAKMFYQYRSLDE